MEGEQGDDSPEPIYREQMRRIRHGLMSLTSNNNNKKSDWIYDSGSEDHMTNNINLFDDYEEISSNIHVKEISGNLKVRGKGIFRCEIFNGTDWLETKLNDVLYVPESRYNLFSSTRALKRG